MAAALAWYGCLAGFVLATSLPVRSVNEAVQPDGLDAQLDALHRDDLGETPPATAFQARWERV